MGQAPSKIVTLAKFLQQPETEPASEYVDVYFPTQQIAVFDKPDAVLPVPSFASELKLTVGELFAWLLE